jgi:hypothetical protein
MRGAVKRSGVSPDFNEAHKLSNEGANTAREPDLPSVLHAHLRACFKKLY